MVYAIILILAVLASIWNFHSLRRQTDAYAWIFLQAGITVLTLGACAISALWFWITSATPPT